MNIWDVAWKCELTFELLVFSFLMSGILGKNLFSGFGRQLGAESVCLDLCC